jgi:hypothetical protein
MVRALEALSRGREKNNNFREPIAAHGTDVNLKEGFGLLTSIGS